MASYGDILKLAKATVQWTKANAKKITPQEESSAFSQKMGDAVKSFNSSDGGKALATGIGMASPLISQGNHNVVGDLGVGLGGAVASFNPLLGGAIMLGGTLVNAATGSNIKEDVVKSYQDAIVDYSRPEITAQDNNQLMNQLTGMKPLKIRRGDLGTQGWFSHKLDDQYGSLLTDLKTAETSRANLIDSAVTNVDKMNDARVTMNYKAFGGPMFGYMSDGAIAYDMARDNLMTKMWNAQNKSNGQAFNTSFAAGGLLSDNFSNGVTEVKAGGSHEKNPYSGVPMGMAEDGQPNLVEEGEAIYNDYVFSNRLKVPKAVRSKYKLRGPKDMTFAEAFLNAQKESKERENDPISKNGLDNIAMVLAQSQEEIRAKNASKRMAQGGHLHATGSLLDEPLYDPSSMTPEEFARINGFYPEGYDVSNWTPEEIERVWPAEGNVAAANANPYGTLNPSFLPLAAYTTMGIYPGFEFPNTSAQQAAANAVTEKGTKGGRNATANLLRFAEPLGNMYAVWSDATHITNTPAVYDYIPDYTPISATPIGEYMPELHMDTRYAANQAAQQAAATRNAIMNTTAPNRWANLLAADYNAQIANGQLLRDAQLAEYDNLLKARTFNRATNQYNSEIDAKVAEENARNRLTYAQAQLAQARANTDETNAAMGARAANIKALTTSLANMGRERDAYDWRDMLMRAGVFGTLSEKPANWTNKEWEEYQKNLGAVKSASNGGKLKKKKRGGFTY